MMRFCKYHAGKIIDSVVKRLFFETKSYTDSWSLVFRLYLLFLFTFRKGDGRGPRKFKNRIPFGSSYIKNNSKTNEEDNIPECTQQ